MEINSSSGRGRHQQKKVEGEKEKEKDIIEFLGFLQAEGEGKAEVEKKKPSENKTVEKKPSENKTGENKTRENQTREGKTREGKTVEETAAESMKKTKIIIKPIVKRKRLGIPNGSRLSSNNTIGYRGVYTRGERFRAEIKVKGKNHHLGLFDTTREAAIAFDRAATRQGRPSAKLNFPAMIHDLTVEPERKRRKVVGKIEALECI